jgi:hypothetical protein
MGGSARFCPQCGQPRDSYTRFCTKCGADLTAVLGSAGQDPPLVNPATGPPTPPLGTPMYSSTQGHPPTAPPSPPSKRRRRLNPILAIVGAVVLAAAAVGATLALTGHKLGGSSSTIQPASHSLSGASANYSSFETAYASLKGAVVRITSVGCDGNGYVGSGFVIDAHHIVTAGHVVEGSQSITIIIDIDNQGGFPWFLYR